MHGNNVIIHKVVFYYIIKISICVKLQYPIYLIKYPLHRCTTGHFPCSSNIQAWNTSRTIEMDAKATIGKDKSLLVIWVKLLLSWIVRYNYIYCKVRHCKQKYKIDTDNYKLKWIINSIKSHYWIDSIALLDDRFVCRSTNKVIGR